MAIIGTALSVASIVLFFTTQVLYANVYKEFVREFNRSYSEASASMEREEESDLTDDSAYSTPKRRKKTITSLGPKNSSTPLIEGDLDNKGKGGTNYKDIIKNTDYQTPSLTPLLGLQYEKSHLSLYW